MSNGRLTLRDIFKRREQEIKAELERKRAYEATPEGQTELAEREAFNRRMAEADERYARENPPNWFAEGKTAALARQPREAPEDLSEEDADAWLAGWDSEGPDDG